MKKKAVSVHLLILLSTSFLLMSISLVTGQLGVNIYLVNPEEEGVVGENVNLQGTIYTTNGRYQIWFDETLVITSYSEGYYVNSNFKIPPFPAGDHTITLRDVTTNVNDTYAFRLKLAYYIEPVVPSSPAQLQEGDNVVLNVTIAGVQPRTKHYANVTVELPPPLSNAYSRVVELVSLSEETVAATLVTYPSASFRPEGSITNYTGLYKVYFNKTESLDENDFFVGFTDSTYYHRNEVVTMCAIGYQSGENATISIKYAETQASIYSQTVTASSEGVFESSWTVPYDALIGEYSITITSNITDKPILDSQIFTVPGYPIQVQNYNLAGEVVSDIAVEDLDLTTGEMFEATSDYEGIASLTLETGNHLLTSFWNGVNVGELNITVTGSTSFDLTCELVNLEITVHNENGNLMPFVTLDITYQFSTTKTSLSQTRSVSVETDLSGTYILNSVLPRISYTINASLYDIVFNVDNRTVTNIPLKPVFKVAILCPSQTLTIKITDYNTEAISNARIEMVEITNGLFNGAVTDTRGTVTVEVTFGKYRLRVYKDKILLNSTVIEVFSDTEQKIRCSLCNIQVSVKVVDYFNQPIANINVQLHRSGTDSWSSKTQVSGVAIFNNVIGGDMQIIAYPDGLESSYEAFSIRVEESKEIEIKLAKYVLIGPFLIEISGLATFVLILIVLLLFASFEVYRRKRNKNADSEN